jgi:putative transposase
MLRDRLGVSERWACRVVGQHRSTQRREPVKAADDEALRAQLRAFAAKRPRWGNGVRMTVSSSRAGA